MSHPHFSPALVRRWAWSLLALLSLGALIRTGLVVWEAQTPERIRAQCLGANRNGARCRNPEWRDGYCWLHQYQRPKP